MNLPELLGFYMTEKHMDDITLARKCKISPMNIVNIKKASILFSQQLVKNMGNLLELNADEICCFMSVEVSKEKTALWIKYHKAIIVRTLLSNKLF